VTDVPLSDESQIPAVPVIVSLVLCARSNPNLRPFSSLTLINEQCVREF